MQRRGWAGLPATSLPVLLRRASSPWACLHGPRLGLGLGSSWQSKYSSLLLVSSTRNSSISLLLELDRARADRPQGDEALRSNFFGWHRSLGGTGLWLAQVIGSRSHHSRRLLPRSAAAASYCRVLLRSTPRSCPALTLALTITRTQRTSEGGSQPALEDVESGFYQPAPLALLLNHNQLDGAADLR